MKNRCHRANRKANKAIWRFASLLVRDFAVLALLAAGCGERQGGDDSVPVPPSANAGTVSTTLRMPHAATVPGTEAATQEESYTNYAFVLPADKRRALAAAVNALALGTTREQVIRDLGEPDVEGTGDAMRWPRRRHRSFTMAYSVAKYRSEFVTTGKDQAISLWFDWQGHLELIRSDNFLAVRDRQTDDADEESSVPGWWDALTRPVRAPTSRSVVRP